METPTVWFKCYRNYMVDADGNWTLPDDADHRPVFINAAHVLMLEPAAAGVTQVLVSGCWGPCYYMPGDPEETLRRLARTSMR